MDQSERNPNQERDRSRAPGHPSIDRVDELREQTRHPREEKGRDEPPADSPRDPSDPWMGGG